MPAPYRGPIIDAHHHLWDLSLGRHPWLAPHVGPTGGLGELAPIRRDYLPVQYRDDARGRRIVATVHVEAGWEREDCVGETRWLETLEHRDGVADRYVAHVPLARADAPALVEAQAAFERVTGVRDVLSWHPDPARCFAARGGLIDDPRWRAGLAALAPFGLVFELMVLPRQLRDAARLASDFPDQVFVLDHCGSPADRDPAGMNVWAEGLAELARRENVMIKISDPVAYDRAWTIESLREVMCHCIERFGADRAMFASDFPVAGLYASFDELYDAFELVAAPLSADEQAALFHDTAHRVYRFADTSAPPGLASGHEQQKQHQ